MTSLEKVQKEKKTENQMKNKGATNSQRIRAKPISFPWAHIWIVSTAFTSERPRTNPWPI
jgi:hypothetical protein